MHIDALEEMGGLDVLGTPKADNQYHAGWAWAGSTPYKGMKLLASHLGGTRNPMAVRWPAKITPDATPRTAVPPLQRHRADDLRDRRHHAARGSSTAIPQDPIDGVSFAYAFNDADAPGRLRHPVLRDHGQPRDLPRRLDGLGLRAAGAVGPGLPTGDPRTGRPTTTTGSSTTSTTTGRRPTTSRRRCPRSSRR